MALGVAVVTSATTWTPMQPVTCPLDGTVFDARLPKTSLTPPADRHLRHGRVGSVYECPRCGWVGAAHDLQRPPATALTEAQRQAMHGHIAAARRRPPVQRHALSAQLADLAGAPPRDVAHRYLQAAAAVGGPDHARYRQLRTAARDAFARRADADPIAAWAAGELSRQLGDRARARRWLERVRDDLSAQPRLRAWASEALGTLE